MTSWILKSTLSFLSSRFSTWSKKSWQKSKFFQNGKSFQSETKSIKQAVSFPGILRQAQIEQTTSMYVSLYLRWFQIKGTCSEKLRISENNYNSIKKGIFAKCIVLISCGSLSPKWIKLSGESFEAMVLWEKVSKINSAIICTINM